MPSAAAITTRGSPPSSRRSRADDTRGRLFAAAAQLFSTRGFHEVTVDEIVRLAGVAKGTFFIHFATKGGVITELVRRQTRAALRARDKARGGGPVARLRASVTALGEQAAMSRGLSRAVLAATLASPDVGGSADALFGEVFAAMIDDARAAQRQKLLAPEPDAETIASTLMASYLGAALHFTASPKPRPLNEILGPLVDANLAGFVRRRGVETKRSPRHARNAGGPR